MNAEMLGELVQRWTAGWRGLIVAGAVALVASAPGLALPVLDREEARTAEATAEMLETGDFIAINFQDQLREGQAVGAYWPQALSVALLSDPEDRQIWAYRIPSLIGAIVTAIACAWGAGAFWGSRTGALAGGTLAATLLAASLGSLATADSIAAGATCLAMAALARIYAGGAAAPRHRKRARILFWGALAAAALAGGWTPLAIAVIAGGILYAADRQAPWARELGWGWGLLAFAAIVGPWLVAITIATDGDFWASGLPAASLPAGLRSIAALGASFPLVALAPPAAVFAWRSRGEPGVRFALAWLVPAWLLFELRPAGSLADALLFFPPLAWLAAAGWRLEPGPVARWVGAGLALLGGAVVAGGVLYLLGRFGDGDDALIGGVTIALIGSAAFACALAVIHRRLSSILIAAALTIAGQSLIVGVLAPRLERLWPSQQVATLLHRRGLDPADGLVQGPVTVAGYDEPSLVFLLGSETEFADAKAAARAINEGRPAIVEARQHGAFAALLARYHLRAQAVATVSGLDYSEGRPVTLTIWRKPQ